MRAGIDLSANNNNTYIQFSFERSLRKYQKQPHKKTNCNQSHFKQSCPHCVQKNYKNYSVPHSQRNSILKQSRKRYNQKSREKARDYSELKNNNQNMISADRSRHKLTTPILQKSLKEISNFNISQLKKQTQKKYQQDSQQCFQISLKQLKICQNIDKIQTNCNNSLRLDQNYIQQDESFSNIQLSQVKPKSISNINQQSQQSKNQSAIETKQQLKDQSNEIECQDNYFSMQAQNEQNIECEQAAQPSYFCFSQSSCCNIEDYQCSQLIYNCSPSAHNHQTPKKLQVVKKQMTNKQQNYPHQKLQKLQEQTKMQVRQQTKKQYRERVIYKLQKVNEMQNNCMECERYSLQIKSTIRVQLEKMEEQYSDTCQNQDKLSMESQHEVQILQQNKEEIKINLENVSLLSQAIHLSLQMQPIYSDKITLKRERRERYKQKYRDEQLWNFGRLKLNKQQNNQILCVSMRSLNKYIQTNWTVSQITNKIISLRSYLQKNQAQIQQMVHNYMQNYKAR